MGPYGKKFGKITTPQISLKFRKILGYRTTHYRTKYFAWALSGLTSRGQIDIQITWGPMGNNKGKL